MLRILLCSEQDLRSTLAGTVIGRRGIEVYRAERLDQIRLLVTSLDPQLLLVDRDLPDLREFVRALREEPSTRGRSLAVLARGAMRSDELELLELGVNTILRLPADDGWEQRLSKLMSVPARQEARIPVHLAVNLGPETEGWALNLSAGGMLLETATALRMHEELALRFSVPDGPAVATRGRVVRQAGANMWGVEFDGLADGHRRAIQQFLRSARLG